MLLDEDKLDLDDPITRWLPEFSTMRVVDDPAGPLMATGPASRPITVEDVMTHRSGLACSYTSTGELSQGYKRLSAFEDDPNMWLTKLAELPLLHQPGALPNYSHSTDVLGILISRIESKPLHVVMSERILIPWACQTRGLRCARCGHARGDGLHAWSARRLERIPMAAGPQSPPSFAAVVRACSPPHMTICGLRGCCSTDGAPILSSASVQLLRTDRLTAAQKQHHFWVRPIGWGEDSGSG